MGDKPSVKNQTRGALWAGHCGFLGGASEVSLIAGGVICAVWTDLTSRNFCRWIERHLVRGKWMILDLETREMWG